MKENWTDDMRKKLEGHKMTPPPDLWESISQQMGLEPEAAAPAKKTVAIKRWYWAVAAVILALVGFFAFYQTDDHQPQLQANHTDTPDHHSILRTPQETVAEAVITEPIAKTVAKPMVKAAAIKQPVPTETIQHPVEPVVSDEPTISEIPKSQPQEVTESEPVSEEPNLQASVEPNYLPEVVDIVPNYSSSEQSDKWTIGLSASSGGLLAANANNHDERIPVYSDLNKYNYSSDQDILEQFIAGNAPYTHTDLVSSHRLPLRFGLSLHYQLNPRVTLISGINYTYLYSEFTIPLYQSISYHQKLHYLGIPLGVAWQLWSTGNFHLYLSGRTMVEKCVSAKVSQGDLNQYPWQWSVNASVGAEYNLSRLLGLYLEPSLGYYFNDGTSLEHYYKEHPLAPAIEFGLRLHLSGN